MKKILLVLVYVLFIFKNNAQTQNFLWARNVGGPNDDFSYSIDIDSSRSVYTVGQFHGTGDFDPGPSTYTLTSSTINDAYISKLDSSGNFKWAKCFGSVRHATARGKVDKAGNVYVIGEFQGNSCDFDPGPGTYTLTTGSWTIYNSFIVKLDTGGNFVWAKQLATDGITGLAIDKYSNVYVTGSYHGIVDFDPGPAINNLIPNDPLASDSYILKLDSSGNYVWAKSVGGTADDSPYAITLDTYGNVYTTGSYQAVSDFSPSPTTYTSGANSTACIFVLKLDASGNFLWSKVINGFSGKSGRAIKTDVAGNVYLTGNYSGSADFDPGSAIYSMTAVGTWDAFIEKLDASGNFVWAKSIGASSASILAHEMALDKFGNVYTVGDFDEITDFDPGPGTSYLGNSTLYNSFISKLDQNGSFVWARSIGTSSNDRCYSIVIDTIGNLYATGDFIGPADFDPGSSTYQLNSTGVVDSYIFKWGPCFTPPSPLNTTTPSNINFCPNASAILTAASTGTVTWHSTPTSTVVLRTGHTYTTPVLASGSYTYYAQAKTCTVNPTRTPIVIYADASLTPTVTATGTNTVCAGSSTSYTLGGCITYSASPATTSTVTGNIFNVLPGSNTNYSIIGVNSMGCKSASATVAVALNHTCNYVWPGDVNSNGVSNNLDVLILGLYYLQTGPPRATIDNSWQACFANTWSSSTINGKNLCHVDCNGDGTINVDDTLAIYNNYGLTHTFRSSQQIVTNPQLSIVPDQPAVVKGSWGTSSVYLGDVTNPVSSINGIAFTVNFDNTLIETNSVWIEYPTSFINVSNQNLNFRKLDFINNNLYTATTHTISNNVSGNGLIAKLHYQIKSSLTTDAILNLGIIQASQSNDYGIITPLTSGTATLMAMGSSVGVAELATGNLITIAPNPASAIVVVSSTTDLEKVEVVNLTGQVLISESVSGKTHPLNVETLANSVYFIKAYHSTKQVVLKKLVIQR